MILRKLLTHKNILFSLKKCINRQQWKIEMRYLKSK